LKKFIITVLVPNDDEYTSKESIESDLTDINYVVESVVEESNARASVK